jgi:hypothetical protein
MYSFVFAIQNAHFPPKEEGNKQSMAFYLDLLGSFSIACDQMETGVWCQEPQGEVDCDQVEDAGEDGELTSNVIKS